MFETILVTLDGSEYSERALGYAQQLAALTGAQVVVLSVVHETDDQKAIDTTRRYLEAQCETLRSDGISSVSVAVRHGDPAEQISEAARELEADLVVLSTSGAGAGERFELGRVALKVLSTAPCPVFTVRINRPAPPRSLEEEQWQDEGGGNVA